MYTEEDLWELSKIISNEFTYVYNQDGFATAIRENGDIFFKYLKMKDEEYTRKLTLELHMPWLYKNLFEADDIYPTVHRNARKEMATLSGLKMILYEKTLSDMPLLVNDPVWKNVAIWRLRISK